ncbi:U3 small nucleolar RNA-associated protein 25 homolog [Microplitis demolitor]|uniref:U3 small nucleolar RNA-associated protein 25 homolog n=1 Tax=Microplitis demolitor TaxID=69319 RepID=UPI0004CC9041|nr:U3 small nucleolar RNA-associated protein 25 homolog [Microplitis demolitor]
MGYGKRPVRGGKRKLDRRNSKSVPKPKVKKGKFNLREASYVKERDAKNAEIENRRKKIEEEEKVKQDEETSDEEEDPMKTLMSTFSLKKNFNENKVVSESESESESEVEDELKKKTEMSDSADESANESQIKLDKILDAGNKEEEEEEEEEEEVDDFKLTIQENEEDDETAREDSGIITDPFSLHLINDLSDDLYTSVSSPKPSTETHQLTWSALGKLIVQIPKCNPAPDTKSSKSLDFIKEDKRYTEPGTIPLSIREIDWNKLHIKNQIQNNITKANYKNIKDDLDSNPSALTPTQKELFSIVNNYQDLLYCERTFDNENEIMFTYCLHTINHLLKTRTKILHHNAKLSKANSLAQIPDEYRDQGLVRPKVLIIVPFRHSCLKIVELLIEILIGDDKGGSVVNKKRFLDEFAGGDTLRMPKKNPKPEDYEKTFSGNIDDTFKIGIALTKKTLKLYCDFYSSDIIITSVLGLRMLVGADGEENRDYDFLSSVELLIMDQCDLFYMQNWDHLIHVLNHLHLQPKELDHGTDFSRVRSWAVNGWAKYYRQTLIFSGVHLPEVHSVFNKFCHNYAGKIKVMNPVSDGSICRVIVQLQQVFYKVDAANYQQAIDARFNFFVNKILPQYKDSIMNHTLIFVPSYFDYVKLRNYFKKEDLNFVQICEYSKDAKIARARDMFFHSDAHYLIYSERFHFFRRVTVKGIRHLIFYAPPTFSNFYSEMCNFMQEANQNPRAGSDNNMTVTTLYTKYDNMQLSAILGTERTSKMIGSDKKIHMVMTGE